MNAGPGAIAALYLHEQHLKAAPTWHGWIGHDHQTRFKMPDDYVPISHSAEAWQLTNPPILQLAALRASLEDFREAGMERLRAKSERLTAYMAYLLEMELKTQITIMTPSDPSARGSQLSLLLDRPGQAVQAALQELAIVVDFREPNVLRAAPTALYNTFDDVYHFVAALKDILKSGSQ